MYHVKDEFNIGANTRVIVLDRDYAFDIPDKTLSVGGKQYSFVSAYPHNWFIAQQSVPKDVSFIGLSFANV